MLFGMERGRGRAAGRDAFSRYEPWENPNYYAGVMRFVCGGRNFRLERSFDRFSRHVSLICEDDGEELSVEHGDLDMLLGDMTPSEFDNTVSVGQLLARPGQELAEALKNYAANYYETGGGEVDLNGALLALKERRREVEGQLKTAESQRADVYKGLSQECGYLEKDLQKLENEYEEARREYENGQRLIESTVERCVAAGEWRIRRIGPRTAHGRNGGSICRRLRNCLGPACSESGVHFPEPCLLLCLEFSFWRAGICCCCGGSPQMGQGEKEKK